MTYNGGRGALFNFGYGNPVLVDGIAVAEFQEGGNHKLISLKQGQYILDARSYTTTLGSAGLNINRQGWTCVTTCTNPYYTISAAMDMTATPPSYTITGTPVSGSVVATDGTLTLDNTGARQRLVNSVNQGW